MRICFHVVSTAMLVPLVVSFGTVSFRTRSALLSNKMRVPSHIKLSADVVQDITSSASSSNADDPWDLYESIIDTVKVRVRVNKKDNIDFAPALQYLTSREQVLEIPDLDGDFEQILNDQQENFLTKTNLTSIQYDYAVKVLTYMGDFCAKKQQPLPLAIAWRKLLESGKFPRENTISTYMYALSLDESTSHLCGEAATVHDLLFEPNEKTIVLRIKSLIASGDAVGAELLLQKLPNNDWTRLRTYLPILYYYCEEADLSSVLRLYRQMQNAPGVHFDADTYAVLISSIAENGGFRHDAVPIEGAFSAGFAHAHGPRLFDDLAQEMANDVLEISNSSVRVLFNGFLRGSKDSLSSVEPLLDDMVGCNDPASTNEMILSRVAVDETTALCPRSQAQLQLFQLDPSNREHVEKTLQSMAKDQFVEFQQKIAERTKKSGSEAKKKRPPEVFDPDYPVQELRNFTTWLKSRDGPFTAIVDGANIAYFGHGTVRYSQIQHVVEKLEAMNERPLVVMPWKYLQPKFHASVGKVQALSEKDLAVIARLEEEGKLYEVPTKCLDDYYWMIASIVGDDHETVGAADDDGRFPGVRPMLITNDQMRDHKLELLEPRLFRRWCSCHIVNYNFPEPYYDEWDARALEFHAADVFSREIQGNPSDSHEEMNDSGSLAWHFPVSEWDQNERFCIRIR